MPGLRARQLEVRDIGGGNEQHKRDGAQQQAERAAHFPRAEHFAQVAALELVCPDLTFFGLTLRDYVHEGLHLRCLDAGPQFRNDTGVRQEIVRDRIRKPSGSPVFDEARPRKRKVRRHDTHHRHRSLEKANRATNDGWIAPELALPESVTDHEHVVFARLTFISGERASQ